MTPILDPDRTEQRLIDLEVKASFMEDLVDQLNAVIVQQQQRLDAMQRELAQLCMQLEGSLGAGVPGGERHLRDELPPHY